MSTMTEKELEERTKHIMKVLTKQWEEAADAGKEQLDNFLTAAVYTIGSCAGYSVQKEELAPMTMRLIDYLTDGVQTGIKEQGLEVSIVKIVKEKS